jgi:hypothetical protein
MASATDHNHVAQGFAHHLKKYTVRLARQRVYGNRETIFSAAMISHVYFGSKAASTASKCDFSCTPNIRHQIAGNVPVPALVYLLDLGKNRVETVHHGLCIDFRGGYP